MNAKEERNVRRAAGGLIVALAMVSAVAVAGIFYKPAPANNPPSGSIYNYYSWTNTTIVYNNTTIIITHPPCPPGHGNGTDGNCGKGHGEDD